MIKRKYLSLVFLIVVLSLLAGGCHSSYSGYVIDAETRKPIEGALAFGQWTITLGIGNTYHKVLATKETLTDRNGKFFLFGSINPLADKPEIIIIKDGYIAWRNDIIFPSWENRENDSNSYIMLEKTNNKFSWLNYSEFIEHAVMITESGNTPKYNEVRSKIFKEGYRRAFVPVALHFKGKVVDAETGKPIKGALILATGGGLGYVPPMNTVSEGLSDENGDIELSGNFPMLERPPNIMLYKQGYVVISDERAIADRYNQLVGFKWDNGYVFKMRSWDSYKKCDPRASHSAHYHFIYGRALSAQKQGKGTLLDLISWEKAAN